MIKRATDILSGMSTTTFTICIILFLVCTCTVLVGVEKYKWFQADDPPVNSKEIASEEEREPFKLGESRLTGDDPPYPGWVKRGGVWRDPLDVDASNLEIPETVEGGLRGHTGQTPRIDKDENAMVGSVAEALESGDHPERLSPWHLPEPFDLDEYLADPESYVNVIEPGRAFVTAARGPETTPLKRMIRRMHQLNLGESVTLKLRAEPGMPVSFYTPNLGSFSNKLTSITVRANDEGVAETQFTATAGSAGEIDIVAASPLNSGLARFFIQVSVPGDPVRLEEAGQIIPVPDPQNELQ